MNKEALREEWTKFWEGKLDGYGGRASKDEIADFWLEKLSSQENALRERVEGLRKDEVKEFSKPGREGDLAFLEAHAYNSALDDILTLLKENQE